MVAVDWTPPLPLYVGFVTLRLHGIDVAAVCGAHYGEPAEEAGAEVGASHHFVHAGIAPVVRLRFRKLVVTAVRASGEKRPQVAVAARVVCGQLASRVERRRS
jgi:hypothetical protein